MSPEPGQSSVSPSSPAPHVVGRRQSLPAWHEIAAEQAGVISVRDALAAGLTRSELRERLASGRWQRPLRGVIVTHSGPLSDEQTLWCAVESIGPPIFLAGATAAALDGLKGFTPDRVAVLVPETRRPGARPGIVVHRSTILGDADIHPVRRPPRTRLERSIIDMASWARSDNHARAVVAAVVQQRLTTPALLRAALARGGHRRRSDLIAATLDDVEYGAHSATEIAYRRIERQFGLPAGGFQAPVDLGGRRRYLDVWYEPWRVWVEIDGGHHADVQQWWDDLDRQNLGVLDDRLVLRFPSHLVRDEPAKVAEQVSQCLRSRGWRGQVDTTRRRQG